VFTQCPKCETIFKLSADVLRTAGGQVRCGRCGEVFNALSRLAEQPGTFTLGESPLEQETRADHILRSSAGQPAGIGALPDPDESESAGPQMAHLEFQDTALDDDAASLEFTLPPGELDRIFVEVKPKVPAPSVLPREFLESARPAPSGEPATVPEPLAEDLLAAAAAGRGTIVLWSAAGVLLLLVLALQIVRENPQWVVAGDTAYAIRVRALFAAVGEPLPAPSNLSAYQLRQWGVSGDPGADGALRVRASILNTANEFEPYPLLRVTLADRFGTRIGARDFAPAEYLGRGQPALLGPGERVDAVLDILDPGKNAEGFELDLCVRGIKEKISCQSDLAARPQ
jgi:predicted Zn finger-like uncharacterized protein